MVWRGQKMGARAGRGVTLLSSAESLLNQPPPPGVSGMPADPKPELHPGNIGFCPSAHGWNSTQSGMGSVPDDRQNPELNFKTGLFKEQAALPPQ